VFQDAVYIPRLLDERERILFFSTYEVASIFGGLMFGQASGQWILALILCVFLFFVTRRADQRGFFDTVGYYCYWYMPAALLKIIQMNYFVKAPSYNRVLVG